MAKTRPPLTRDRILDAAIRLADDGGLDSVSMRKVGQALGVEAMSLYNHVANKDDLLEGMVERVIDEFELPDEGDWEQAVRRCAISAHDALLRHRWSPTLVMAPGMGISAARLRYMNWILGRLSEAGFSAELTYRGYHALDSHIFGFTLWQLGHANASRAFAARDDEPMEEIVERMLEQVRPSYPYLAEHGEMHMADGAPNGKQEFEFGLDLILDGLRRKQQER